MTRVFVDTSAMFAFLVPTDHAHGRASATLERLRDRRAALLTTSFNLVETYTLIDRRIGRHAVRAFRAGLVPLLEVGWVDSELHERGLDLLMNRPAGVSLVDAVSFVYIRENRVDEVFAFDRHFEREGFAIAG